MFNRGEKQPGAMPVRPPPTIMDRLKAERKEAIQRRIFFEMKANQLQVEINFLELHPEAERILTGMFIRLDSGTEQEKQ